MNNLGSPKIDISKLIIHFSSYEIEGSKSHPEKMIEGLSMVSMKLNNDNYEHVKYLSTEGLCKDRRKDFVTSLQDQLNSEVFELSTCNRVLYVGFGVPCETLEQAVLQCSGLNNAPFEHHTGLSVWKKLVEVCSGLDSFILGELQVMSQFRGSVSWHKKNGLLSLFNSSFFDHVVSANRIVRKTLGFNKTTESMMVLAQESLEREVKQNSDKLALVIGSGDMGAKAVEVLGSSGMSKIVVACRNPEKAIQRYPEITKYANVISLENYLEKQIKPSLIISTIRSSEVTFNKSNPLPSAGNVTVMDFSWPPSVDKSAVKSGEFLGMEHWIRMSHKLGKEWNYNETIEASEKLLQKIENKFTSALSDRSQAKFRTEIYSTLEKLSKGWQDSIEGEESEPNMEAFSREIATWICKQSKPFDTTTLENMVKSSKRQISPNLLQHIADNVNQKLIEIHNSTL